MAKLEALDKAYSLYIRYRDVEKHCGYGKCCTCGKLIKYSQGHCGHFMSRRHMATRFDEQNSNLQCPACNIFDQGRQVIHGKFIDSKYGPGTADRILARSRGTKKFEQFEIDALTEHYQKEAERLKKEKGL